MLYLCIALTIGFGVLGYLYLKKRQQYIACKTTKDILFTHFCGVILKYGGTVTLSRWEVSELDDIESINLAVIPLDYNKVQFQVVSTKYGNGFDDVFPHGEGGLI